MDDILLVSNSSYYYVEVSYYNNCIIIWLHNDNIVIYDFTIINIYIIQTVLFS